MLCLFTLFSCVSDQVWDCCCLLLSNCASLPSGGALPIACHVCCSLLDTQVAVCLCLPKRRWEWEDLERYVQDLRGPGQTAEALLLKYTRASQAKPTDPVTYSMR